MPPMGADAPGFKQQTNNALQRFLHGAGRRRLALGECAVTILMNIQSSPNPASASRAISSVFIEQYCQSHGPVDLVDLDLAIAPPRHVGSDHLAAYFAPAEYHTPENAEALRGSDAYIAQLVAADVLVIGTPMHNLGVASVLKSWIDNVCRIGRTFKYDETGTPVGLLAPNKRAIIVIGSGGIYSKGPMQSFDYAAPYLSAVLRLMGVYDITVIHAEATTLRQELAESCMAAAREAAIAAAGADLVVRHEEPIALRA